MKNRNAAPVREHISLSSILILFCLLLFSACAKQPLDLNVMTFNIRYDNPDDSLNNWQFRKDAAAWAVSGNNVDVLGTQEVLDNQLHDLLDRLPDYASIGVGREDGKDQGEYSAIFYKKDKFEIKQSSWFWLSETPEIAGSKGWDGACERIATWAIMKDIATGQRFFMINTHLDHVGKMACSEGIKLLLARTGSLSKGLPVIITGDLNSKPESDVIQQVTADGKYRDSRLLAAGETETQGTFHAFGRIPPEKRNVIDYVFVNEKITVNSYQVLPEKKDSVFISDHTPVLVKMLIK